VGVWKGVKTMRTDNRTVVKKRATVADVALV
jgi:hypothetical protein